MNGARGRVREAQRRATWRSRSFDGVVLNALRETETQSRDLRGRLRRAPMPCARRRNRRRNRRDETHRLYIAGRESFIADLDATRTLTSTNSQVAAAEGQVALDQVNLFLALGGGWETPPASERPAVARK